MAQTMLDIITDAERQADELVKAAGERADNRLVEARKQANDLYRQSDREAAARWEEQKAQADAFAREREAQSAALAQKQIADLRQRAAANREAVLDAAVSLLLGG